MSRIEATGPRNSDPIPVEADKDSALVDTLPPTDPRLDTLLATDDPGAAMAGLLLVAGKQRRDSARISRDASYAAEEAAQQEEVGHMRSSANIAFASGLAQGAMQLASAADSAGNAYLTSQAGDLKNEASRAHSEGNFGSEYYLTQQSNRAGLQAGLLDASGKGAGATGTLAGAFGKLATDAEDREAKAAANKATAMKRSADGASEDVRDAEASLKKALDLYKEWQATKNACLSAAIHRA